MLWDDTSATKTLGMRLNMAPTTRFATFGTARALAACALFVACVSAQGAPDEAVQFATVWRIRGDITAASASSGVTRPLRDGDAVRVGERVRAGPAGEAVLKTGDAGYVAVRPGAEFIPERFAAEGKPSDNVTLRLISGGLRVITGWIGQINRAGHRVVTSSATIGVRGTDHEPYVISAELAANLSQRAGTYDKVNRGGTTMEVDGKSLDIEPGKVGFVRATKPVKTRALMTLLLPVLLDKVPDFYVPGQFDAELDRLTQEADAESERRLEERRKAPPPSSAAPKAASPAATPVAAPAAAPPTTAAPLSPAACDATDIGRAWLRQLDDAIVRRDAESIVALFAEDVAVKANIRGGDGALKTVELSRDELAQSTVDAVSRLKNYKQRRPAIEGRPAGDASACARIAVRSVSIEQGKQAGKPYRFESLEEYVLERRDGKWLAIKAETTQR